MAEIGMLETSTEKDSTTGNYVGESMFMFMIRNHIMTQDVVLHFQKMFYVSGSK